jgi:phosphoribosylaminoimidazole-succinocarboxamide synthase
LEIPGFRHIYSGKVRELYEPINPEFAHLVLIIATDRVSAFDQILEPEIPGKGENLTALTNFWFDYLENINHRSNELEVPEYLAGRGMIAKRLEMYPIECVVRGYLSGSGWLEYQESGGVCGIKLPAGLKFGDRLPHPIFTPAFKAAQGDHDENISFEKTIELVGLATAEQLRDASLSIFIRASQKAARSGIILADTKFEFGNDPRTNLLTLGDEVLTPDSSRYWSKELWDQGVRDQSFDKQIIRNWLSANWDKSVTPPHLPNEIVQETASQYELIKKLITSVP